MSEGRFTGRRVIVTGASRGIGAAVAQRLAAEGADVAITARTLDRHPSLEGSLHETAKRLEPFGGAVAVITADLSDPEDRARIVPEATRSRRVRLTSSSTMRRPLSTSLSLTSPFAGAA